MESKNVKTGQYPVCLDNASTRSVSELARWSSAQSMVSIGLSPVNVIIMARNGKMHQLYRFFSWSMRDNIFDLPLP